jgi:hypothetical protein
LPTPNSKDGTIGETLRPGETITETGGLPRRGVTETSDGYSLTLGRHVQMFPTPTQFDATCGDLKGKEYTGENRHAMKLIQAATMFPTPTGDDANNATRTSGAFQSLTRTVTRGSAGTDAHPSTPSGSGSLSAVWVSWLMGFPPGWLDD